MTHYTVDRLYALLPAVYRLRDAEEGEPLRQLLGVLARQISLVEDDIEQLYANWFIETCAEWVAPYIGDLLGVRGLHQVAESGFTRRAHVANTLRFRRRKGTATMLEQLARDATLWTARAVEYFELLSATQYLNHVRLHNVRTPDLRRADLLELLETPFDTAAHTADVRRIARNRGRHNIANVGIFLWRLQAYHLPRVTLSAVSGGAAGRYTFSPLGNDAPLFNRPQTEDSITHLAEEVNVPGVLRRRSLHDDLEQVRAALTAGETALSRYLGPRQPAFEIFFDQPCTGANDCAPLRPEEIVVCDLSGWDAPGWEPPASTVFDLPTDPPTAFATRAAVDPLLGRLAVLRDLPDSPPAAVEARYAYGFSGDLGGGPYDRRALRRPGAAPLSGYEDTVAVPHGLDALITVGAGGAPDLTTALADWAAVGKPDAVIEIADSRTYVEDLDIEMGTTDLVIQAANGQRPLLAGRTRVLGTGQTRLTFNGLLVAGALEVVDDDSLRQLDIAHCTFVPGRTLGSDSSPQQPAAPSIEVGAANIALRLNITRTICGPLHMPADMVELTVRDSIVEAPQRGRPAQAMPVLVGGRLSAFPALGVPQPRLLLTIGAEGPYEITLSAEPTTVPQARNRLQEAIRAAGAGNAGPAFAQAHVLSAEDRLIVLPGAPHEVRFEPAEGDASADLLKLTPTEAQTRRALRSGALTPYPTLSAPAPAAAVTLAGETQTATLASVPATLAQARDQLQAAIRAVGTGDAFAAALVLSIAAENRLVVVPGAGSAAPRFAAAPDDATTVDELRLSADVFALAGSDDGLEAGPPALLERVTVLGPVRVKELQLASETIFGERVNADRRQAGCVRFSYVPPGSRTPQRFRCQPDSAIAAAVAAAEAEAGGPIGAALEAALAAQQARRVTPSFTSTVYGQPAYGQLGLDCPEEITTGAEDGAEMGAFNFLKQPQRVLNLRASLDEYLRLGLEAGIFFVT